LRALRWYAPYDVRVEDVPEPRLVKDTDALVRPTLTTICGSDLHIYRGHLNIVPGNILGHEFVGVVEEVGAAVRSLSRGDRVLPSCWVADGTCWYCRHGYYTQCVNVNIFGFGPVYGESLEGALSELVRVPYADTVLSKLPDDVTDDKAVLVSDTLPAGFAAVQEGGVKAGDMVAVVGAGAVGLLAGLCAKLLGAGEVIVVDVLPERLEMARSLGFMPIDASLADAAEQVRSLTDGRGADVVVEAVGGEQPLLTAIDLARKKGTISVAGFHIHEYTLPAGQLWLTEKRLIFCIGDPIKYRRELIEHIRAGRLDPSRMITHRLRLEEAPKAFEMADRKQGIRVALTP
jgi:threonine dehydrogenase-like Zn-dependent dehydrogenase